MRTAPFTVKYAFDHVQLYGFKKIAYVCILFVSWFVFIVLCVYRIAAALSYWLVCVYVLVPVWAFLS